MTKILKTVCTVVGAVVLLSAFVILLPWVLLILLPPTR
jgi:hypothetical protein